MDNSASIETVVDIKPKMGRPVGSKKRLGIPLAERLKILESIARSKDPDVKDTDKLGAVKLMSELLGDKVDPSERQLPIYTLRIELDKSGKVDNNMPVTAPNSPVKVVKVVEQAPIIPMPDYNDLVQDTLIEQDIGDELAEEGKEDGNELF